MVDIANLKDLENLFAADFEFHMGNSDDPSDWAVAPAPSEIAVRPGAGQNGSARVTLVWQPGQIRNTWLQVTVKANANTGLAAPDVFYLGNTAGDANGDRLVNATDISGAFANLRGVANPAPVEFPFDVNRDRFVNATDISAMFANLSGIINALRLIQPPGTAADTRPPETGPAARDAGEPPTADALALSTRRAAWDWWRRESEQMDRHRRGDSLWSGSVRMNLGRLETRYTGSLGEGPTKDRNILKTLREGDETDRDERETVDVLSLNSEVRR